MFPEYAVSQDLLVTSMRQCCTKYVGSSLAWICFDIILPKVWNWMFEWFFFFFSIFKSRYIHTFELTSKSKQNLNSLNKKSFLKFFFFFPQESLCGQRAGLWDQCSNVPGCLTWRYWSPFEIVPPRTWCTPRFLPLWISCPGAEASHRRQLSTEKVGVHWWVSCVFYFNLNPKSLILNSESKYIKVFAFSC